MSVITSKRGRVTTIRDTKRRETDKVAISLTQKAKALDEPGNRVIGQALCLLPFWDFPAFTYLHKSNNSIQP